MTSLNGATGSATLLDNDAAATTPAVIGGTDTDSVTEDLNVTGKGNLTTSGALTITDPDSGEAAFSGTVTPAAGRLGSLTLSPSGTWTYSVSNALVQYLKAGESKVETFTVQSVDGTAHSVTVTLRGANDPAMFAPDGQQGTVQEDTQLTSQGQLSLIDTDQNEAMTVAQAGTRGLYGEFSIDTAGRWRYASDTAGGPSLPMPMPPACYPMASCRSNGR